VAASVAILIRRHPPFANFPLKLNVASEV